MKIGFVVPSKIEAAPLLKLIVDQQKVELRGRIATAGLIGKIPCTLMISGLGKVLSAGTTQQLIDNFSPTLIFHIGTAGALAPHLKIGDLILSEEIIEHDHYSFTGIPKIKTSSEWNQKIFNFIREKNKNIFSGITLSGSEDIVNLDRKNELFSQYKALSVDWESFSVAKIAQIASIPTVVLRSISDYAHENTIEEFKINVTKVSFEISSLIEEFFKLQNS